MAKRKGGCLKTFLIFILVILLIFAALIAAILFTPVKKVAKLAHIEDEISEEIDLDVVGDLRIYDAIKLLKNLQKEPQVEHVDIPTEDDVKSLDDKNIINEEGEIILEEGTEYTLNQNEVAILVGRLIDSDEFIINGCSITSNKIGFSFTLDLDSLGVELLSIPGFGKMSNPIMYFEYNVNVSGGRLSLSNGSVEISGVSDGMTNIILDAALGSLNMGTDEIGNEVADTINKIGEIKSISSKQITFIGKQI